MIPRIDTFGPFEKPLSPYVTTQKGGEADFHSLLKGRIEGSTVIERIALDFLRKTVDLALLDTKPEETDFPSLPSLFLPLKPPVSQRFLAQPQPAEVQLELIEVEPDAGMSENLRGKQDFESIVQEAGERYGVSPSLIKAVIQVESGGNPIAVSKAGARGLMQLMPETAAELGVTNPYDPRENIMAGTRYLRQLLDRYRGDQKLALAAYNWGMGNLEKRPEAMPKETKNFIASVESHYRNYTKS